MISVLKSTLFLISTFVITSCSKKPDLYNNIQKYYEAHEHCTDDNYCTFALEAITNFEWDTMKLRENDAGVYVEFYNRGKIAHSYFKDEWVDWSNPNGIEFGIPHNITYAKEDCVFGLKTEQKNSITKDYTFYILPLDSIK